MGLRSMFAKAAPVVSTTAVMFYTREKGKSWAWAIGSGLLVHYASSWLVSTVLNGLDASQALPQKPVEVADNSVKVPELAENPAEFHQTPAPGNGIDAVGRMEVIDKNNNIIKLPTAMGQP